MKHALLIVLLLLFVGTAEAAYSVKIDKDLDLTTAAGGSSEWTDQGTYLEPADAGEDVSLSNVLSVSYVSSNKGIRIFDDIMVSDTSSTPSLRIYRHAPEGTSYLNIFLDQYGNSTIDPVDDDGDDKLSVNNSTTEFTGRVRVNTNGSSGYPFTLYGPIGGVKKAIDMVIDDSLDDFTITRSDTTILSTTIGMPFAVDVDESGSDEFVIDSSGTVTLSNDLSLVQDLTVSKGNIYVTEGKINYGAIPTAGVSSGDSTHFPTSGDVYDAVNAVGFDADGLGGVLFDDAQYSTGLTIENTNFVVKDGVAVLDGSTIEFRNTDGVLNLANTDVDISGDVTVTTDLYVEGDIIGGVNYLSISGSRTITKEEMNKGTVVYCDGPATITLPAISTCFANAGGLVVHTIGDVAISVDPNAADYQILDGTVLDDGDKATNGSSSGDVIVVTRFSSDGWYSSSNSWTDGGA